MTDAVKERSIFSTPAMSVEGSTGTELETPPVRLSGFVALVLGLVSFVAVLGAPLLVVPVIAVAFALLALRPYPSDRPLGVSAAAIGLFFAVLFGVWGFTERQFRTNAMSTQATRFAGEWLNLVSQGDFELAIELQIHPSRRQPESMPLADFYRGNEEAIKALQQFKNQSPVPQLIELGTKVKWTPSLPAKVYTQYGRELTRTVWRDSTGTFTQPVKVILEYIQMPETNQAHWKIDSVSEFIDDSDRL
jgi:hypothetical protein